VGRENRVAAPLAAVEAELVAPAAEKEEEEEEEEEERRSLAYVLFPPAAVE